MRSEIIAMLSSMPPDSSFARQTLFRTESMSRSIDSFFAFRKFRNWTSRSVGAPDCGKSLSKYSAYDTIVSLNEIFAKKIYDSSKSRFRCFLKTICQRRVVDYLRKNAKGANFGSIDDDESDVLCSAEKLYAESKKVELQEAEKRAFRESLLLDAYMSIRHKFDARTCAAFEMIKLEDIDVETVVRELGVSQNAVNNAVYRIMKKLKETVQKERELKCL